MFTNTSKVTLNRFLYPGTQNSSTGFQLILTELPKIPHTKTFDVARKMMAQG